MSPRWEVAGHEKTVLSMGAILKRKQRLAQRKADLTHLKLPGASDVHCPSRLHQFQQIFYDGLTSRRQPSVGTFTHMAGEHLYRYEAAVSRRSSCGGPSVIYVPQPRRFRATSLSVQSFWHSPPCSGAKLMQGTPYGIQISIDRSVADFCDACTRCLTGWSSM